MICSAIGISYCVRLYRVEEGAKFLGSSDYSIPFLSVILRLSGKQRRSREDREIEKVGRVKWTIISTEVGNECREEENVAHVGG